MKIIRERKLLIALVTGVLLYWLVPSAVVWLDEPSDYQQNRCGTQDKKTRQITMHRPVYNGKKPPDPISVPRPGYDDGQVRVIRLTDSGEFIDRCELTDVLYDLNWDHPKNSDEYYPKPKPDAEKLPKFVVLYIHGWKHGPAADDSDLVHFTDLVKTLSADYRHNKQVLGVYVSWNATSKVFPLNLSPFNNLTFWSKETIADRIAQSAVSTKIISSISSTLLRDKEDQFVVVGHSFGARLAFSATNQSLIYDTAKAHPGHPRRTYKPFEGMASAVILLNPAFEASRYVSIDAITRTEESFDPSQLPLLISISSTGDWATRIFFPAGQWLGFYRSPEELTTLGNFTKFKTHTLRRDMSLCGIASKDLSESFAQGKLCLSRDPIPTDDTDVNARTKQPRNPFLIAQTTPDIIKDHTHIWGEEFSNWLYAYIRELGNRNHVANSG